MDRILSILVVVIVCIVLAVVEYFFSSVQKLKKGKRIFYEFVEKLAKNGKGSVLGFLQELSKKEREALRFWVDPGLDSREQTDEEERENIRLIQLIERIKLDL